MKTKIKKLIGGLVLAVLVLAMPMNAYALKNSYSASYALRQLSLVPDSSWVKEQKFTFTATAGNVTVTCTQDTTSGAKVFVDIKGNISGSVCAFLDVKGASLSLPVESGETVVVVVYLQTPDSYNYYTGYGTIVN